ncbi:carboxypeptidase N subunit 2-like [Lineus longissimus]|uniref:carboxypeptidase N subunit 2-like n=1 Tax=Lineus longissimus TaxID=88925 RepID=UPI002B4F7E35
MFRLDCQAVFSITGFIISVLISLVASDSCPETCRCQSTRVNCSTPFTSALLRQTLESLSEQTTVLSIVYTSSILPAYLFYRLSLLRKLEIRGDQNFHTLHKDSFTGLYNLRKLIIVDTNIKTLPADFVMPLIKLRHIDISRNKLGNLIDNTFFWSSKNITYLDMSRNELSNLPWGIFRHVPNIETLHLGENNLGRLDVDFSTASKLQKLYLENSNLTQLGERTFIGLTSLNILVLKNNQKLVEISQTAFEPLENLRTLQLENGSYLNLVSEMFLGLSKLTHLYLSSGFRNTILPFKVFNGLKSLRTLDLSFTNLTTITSDDLEPIAESVQNLNLSHTDMKILENNTFSDCVQLKELNLSNASNSKGVGTFEAETFGGLSNLTKLDIGQNSFQTLSYPFIQILTPLKSATIFANSDNLTCDCGVLPFVKWLTSNSIDIRMKCLRPSWVYSHDIKTLNAQTLRCVKPDGYENTLILEQDGVGKTVTVSCIAYGYHDYPNVSYTVTGNPLVKDKTDEFRNLRIDDNLNQYVTNLTFKIHGFKPENSGSIHCIASNEFGNTSWEMKIAYENKQHPKAIIVPWAIVVIVLAVVVTVTVVVCWCIRRTKEPDELNEDEDDEDEFSPSDEF